MVTPRRRPTSTIGLEPSEDTTKTKVVIPKGTKAMVTEQIGAKTVSYESELEEDTSASEDQNGLNDTEDFSEFDESAHYPQPQKSALDLMFEDVQFSVANENMYDTFFAKLIRQPDAINDKFTLPCRDIIEIGVIQFSSLDRFNFIPAIQDANNNSGGRFAISIYDSEYKAFETMRNMTYKARPVGLILVVPNPQIKPINDNGHGTSDTSISAALIKIAEINQENHNRLMNALNRKPEKSTLELAIEQKVLNDILNPLETRKSGFDPNEFTQNLLTQGTVIAGLGEAFNKMIFREPPAPAAPTIIDQINQVTEMPLAKELASRLMDIGDALAVKNLNLGAETPQQQPTENNSNQVIDQVPDEMQELTLDIINELESKNVLNADNETIKEMQTDYPDQFADLVVMCKTAPFETVFSLLLNKCAKMQPFPFVNYLNVAESQATNNYIWNEQGDKIISRLRELYEHLKTIS